jgi:multidrug resistance efflux pump
MWGNKCSPLIDARTWWAIGNFREGELQHIVPGMRADVYFAVETEFAIFGCCGQRGLWRYS